MQSYTSICSPESKPPSLKPFVNEVVSRRTMLYFRPGTVWGVMDLLLPVNNLVWTRLEDSSCPFFDSHIKLYPYLCWVLFDSSLLSLLHTTYICILLVSIGIFWIFDNMIRTWSNMPRSFLHCPQSADGFIRGEGCGAMAFRVSSKEDLARRGHQGTGPEIGKGWKGHGMLWYVNMV